MYKLQVSPEFDTELADAKNYILFNLQNPDAVKRLLIKVKSTLKRLKGNPMLHPLYHSKKIADMGYRYVPIGNYLLFYTIDDAEKIVHIARFIYARRNIDKML